VYAYGSQDTTLATRYRNCHFEDLEYPLTGTVYRYDYLITFDLEESSNILFDKCSIAVNKQKSMYLSSNTGKVVLKNTDIMHEYKTLANKANICVLNGASLYNVNFYEDYDSVFNRSYVISGNSIDVKDCVHVEGDVVKFYDWYRSNVGMTGWIKPGLYQDYVKNTLNVITYPVGGETLEDNHTCNITWEVINKAEKVAILLYKDCAFYDTIIASTANNGLYKWFIDTNIVPDTSYTIKLVAIGGNPSAFSFNNYFSIVKSTVGVNPEILSETSIYISPNPANTRISVRSGNAINEIVVFNILGQQQFIIQSKPEDIDISKWQTGIYIFMIKTNKGTVIKKLIKE
jgi:hypothetical protein